jgi:hypothetical protein
MPLSNVLGVYISEKGFVQSPCGMVTATLRLHGVPFGA